MKRRILAFGLLMASLVAGCAEKERPAASAPAADATSAPPATAPHSSSSGAGVDAGVGAATHEGSLCDQETEGLSWPSGKCPDDTWAPSAANASTTPLVGTPEVHQIVLTYPGGDGGGVDVMPTVRQAFPKFLACYTPTKQRVTGKVIVRFEANHAGVVEKATAIKGSTMPDPAVIDCVVREFRALKLPSSARAIYSLGYDAKK